MSWNRLKIGEIFIRLGLITQDQLEKAVEIQKTSGKRLGRILIEQNFFTEEEFVTALALQKGLPVVNLNDYRVNVQAVNTISEELAHQHIVIPIDYNKGKLVLAMANPLDIHAIDDVSLVTGVEIEVVVATESQILQAINRYLTDEGCIKDAVELAETTSSGKKEEETEDVLEDTPIVRLANQIILQGVEQGASDIHIEPQAEKITIRYRIDGVLHNVMTIPQKVQPSLISRFKIMSGLNIAEHRIPQDGRHSLKVGPEQIDLRIALIPTAYGENISIRIHHKSRGMMKLEELGFQPDVLEQYQLSYTKPYGTILVTGPTGCGKSTTLYATLNILNSPTKKIFTVEDPVEYSLPGVLQVQVNPKVGLTFANALRSIIRCDPDIMMIGEIRDMETAKIAVESALTGHLVFSTLHTNDAPSAITRLIEMGIEPFLVSSAIDCVVAQRLARKLCDYCKEPYKPTGRLLERLNIPEATKDVTIYQAKGCDKCYNTGYQGRTGLFEVMTMTSRIARMSLDMKSSDEIREAALEEGMQSMMQDGLRKVIQGITSIEEVMRVVI
jgi:type IV pilus assembly protein PilB